MERSRELEQAMLRRKAATKATAIYFAIGFMVVLVLSAMTVFGIEEIRARNSDRSALRREFCTEIEGLKEQNREAVFHDAANYSKNLRLLKLTDTPELRQAAIAGWNRTLARNVRRSCPYTPGQKPKPPLTVSPGDIR